MRPPAWRPPTAPRRAHARPKLDPSVVEAGKDSIDSILTDWAGLALVLPVLLREGFAAQAAASRDRAAVWVEVLVLAQRRHRLDAAATRWIEHLRRRYGAAPEAVPDCRQEAAAWWRRVRLATLREARLPVRTLLHRQGEVWCAPHRIDVSFALRSADVRIRRAGFDIDPGYLPWLDAVLRLHYV